MAFTQPLSSLIADSDGTARTDFLTCSAEAWAAAHMGLRYNQAPPGDDEGSRSVARACFDHLRYEHSVLRSWFTEERRMSLLLQTPFITALRRKPIGDGMGWDFRPSGEAEPQMMQFKSTLMFADRLAGSLAPAERNMSNLQFAGLARLVRAAYLSRSELHAWRPVMGREGDPPREVIQITGEQLAGRWAAYQTMCFMVRIGADPHTAWMASKCGKIFGPIDDAVSAAADQSSV